MNKFRLILNVLFWKTVGLLVNAKPQDVPHNPKRILIMRYGFLGDVLQTTPLLRFVSERYPDSTLDYWVSRKAVAALDNNPRVHSLVDADLFGPLTVRRCRSILQAGLSLRKKRYDMALCLSSDPLYGLIAWLATIRLRIGLITSKQKSAFLHRYNVVSLGNNLPRQKHYNDLAKLLGSESSVPAVYPIEMYWHNDDEHYVDGLVRHAQGPLIAFFPGGGENVQFRPWAERKWPAEKWIAFGNRVLAEYPQARLLFFGAAGDAAVVQDITKKLEPERTVNVVNKTTFSQLGPLLKKCRLLVTNDTAPVFVAAATGCPAVVIYGPELPERARPLGVQNWRAVFVEKQCRVTCASFPVSGMSCSNDCISEITVDMVMEQVRTTLAEDSFGANRI